MLSDAEARQRLHSQGIKALPVTIVDDHEVIIGYYPKKLIPTLKLDVKVDLSSKSAWLSDKYDRILGATLRAAQQLSAEQLQQQVPWRPERLRDTVMHILSFPELAWLSHRHGSMSSEDMQASKEQLKDIVTVDAITRYGEGVRRNIAGFLKDADNPAFDRVVPAHYGGEVTVLELLNIILSHSTHHLKQVYWFMENVLEVAPQSRASAADLEGIVTPEALF